MSSQQSKPPDEGNEQPASTSSTESPPHLTQEIIYPLFWRQILVVISLLLSVFLSGLDISIIANAIPSITSDFNSLGDVGWYSSAFFLADAALQPLWAKAYKFIDLKWTFVASTLLFELGCLVAAVAPNSPALAVGRALQGGGAAGILLGAYAISNFVVPPEKVPIIVGLIGSIFSVSSVVGPLIGGVFASDASLTWRWCFWINLPIGAVPLALIIFFFRTQPQAKSKIEGSAKDIIAQFDPIGTVLFIGALISFVLGTTWAGVTYAWSSSTIIGLLVGSILITILFILNEFWQKENAFVVLRVLKNRDMWTNCLFLFLLYGPFFAMVYTLPIYFQAVVGLSPRESGIRTIPLIGASSVFSFIGSIAVSKYARYSLFMLVGAAVCTVSAGLIYTLDENSNLGEHVGYQFLLGFGMGPVVQIPPIVAGIVNKNADKSLGLGAVLVIQFTAASIVTSTASAITNSLLIRNLPHFAPGLDPSEVLSIGPEDLQTHFGGDDLLGVRRSYVVGLQGAWALCIALWAASTLSVGFTKWPGHIVPAKEEASVEEKELRGKNQSDTSDLV